MENEQSYLSRRQGYLLAPTLECIRKSKGSEGRCGREIANGVRGDYRTGPRDSHSSEGGFYRLSPSQYFQRKNRISETFSLLLPALSIEKCETCGFPFYCSLAWIEAVVASFGSSRQEIVVVRCV